MSLFNNKHPLRRADSFKYAFEGIFHALFNEPNFRIQMVIVLVSVTFGFYFNISNVEWAILTISLGLLLSAEMINTVVEEVIDYFIKEDHEGAKVIKDLSAGFVLIAAGIAAVILGLIFGPKVILA